MRTPALLGLLLVACTSRTPPPPPLPAKAPAPVAAAVVDAGPQVLAPAEVTQLLALNCQSCHSLAYIHQQRLTAGQWTATLTKMRSWGALLEEAQLAPLATALAATRGPSAPKLDVAVVEVPAFQIEADSAPGEADRGKGLFEARCLACHGADARGGIGVNLGDRPILQQPAKFAAYLSAGRGRMPPQTDLQPAQLADLLAFLRTL